MADIQISPMSGVWCLSFQSTYMRLLFWQSSLVSTSLAPDWSSNVDLVRKLS